MYSFISVIFSKSYRFCSWISNDDEFSELYAAGVLATICFSTIFISLKLVGFHIAPEAMLIFSGYAKYLSLAFVGVFWIFFGKRKNYLPILSHYKQMPKLKVLLLFISSIIYCAILVVLFFVSAELYHDYYRKNFL